MSSRSTRDLGLNRELYEIASEPRGAAYRQLIAAAVRFCDRFLFVDVPSPHFREGGTSFGPRSLALVESLRTHLLSMEKGKSWPGTTLSDREGFVVFARIYWFRLDPTSADLLAQAADGLYEWRWPELPRDLCLMRSRDDEWLVNMAADEDAYLWLTQAEANQLTVAIPSLELHRSRQH
jgi:hypothetical protein